jgi:hypothetical protein
VIPASTFTVDQCHTLATRTPQGNHQITGECVQNVESKRYLAYGPVYIGDVDGGTHARRKVSIDPYQIDVAEFKPHENLLFSYICIFQSR